jgi:uncharacterized protein
LTNRAASPNQWDPAKLKQESRHRLQVQLRGYQASLCVEIPFHVLVGSSRKPNLLVMAGVHGDEYEGVAVLHDLAKEIDPKKLRGTLTLVPVANPQAFYAGTRRNPIDLGDLNRAFPGNPEGTLTDRLAHTLFHELVLGNDYVLSMHGWSKESVVVPYVEYPLGNDGACQRSFAAAKALGMEFLHPYKWPKGVLGEAAIRHGISPIEPEVGGMGTVTLEGHSTYREMVYRLLFHLDMYQANKLLTLTAPVAPKIIDHVDVLANHAGLFRSLVSLRQTVAKNQLLGTVHGLSGKCVEELRSPQRGFVGILRTFGSVHPGDRLVQLFRQRRVP